MFTKTCPNCGKAFYGSVPGEYCNPCWIAWSKADGSFEKRTKSLSDMIAEALNK